MIYEMHVRGFSHTSPTAEAPGTCASHSPPHAALKLAGRGRAGARVQHLGGLHRTTVRKGVKGVPESQPNRKVVVVKALEVHWHACRARTHHQANSRIKSPCCAAGTYAGITENLGYLKSLGINAIELLPVHEFNEMEYYRVRSQRSGVAA